MKRRWPRAAPITRVNHGVDYDRIEAHANVAGMGDFNCRVEIDLSPRGRPIVYTNYFLPPSFFPSRSAPSFSCPSLATETRVSAFSRHGNTYRYYATSLAKPPKSNMKFSAWAKFNGVLLYAAWFYLYPAECLSRDFIQWSLKTSRSKINEISCCAQLNLNRRQVELCTRVYRYTVGA